MSYVNSFIPLPHSPPPLHHEPSHIQALPPGLTTPCRVNTAMDSPHRVHFAEQLVETEPDNGTASAAPSRGDGDAAEGAQAAEAAGAAPVNATKADGNLPTCDLYEL